MGVGGQHHAPTALPPGKTRYPLYSRLGGPQGRSGRVRKISPSTGIRSPDRPAPSESPYRLSYRSPECSLCIQGISDETRTPVYSNLIGRSMTALPPVLSPSSTLPQLRLTALSLPQGKIRRSFEKCRYFDYLLFKNCATSNCVSWGVSAAAVSQIGINRLSFLTATKYAFCEVKVKV